MEKSEMMKRYEAETGKKFSHMQKRAVEGDINCTMSTGYVAWLEAKAAAYDRVMSGGKKTLKEWANLLGRPVAMDIGGVFESYNSVPMRCDSAGYWYCDEYAENFEDEHFIIPNEVVDYTGSWQDSLTLPDGWEEAN